MGKGDHDKRISDALLQAAKLHRSRSAALLAAEGLFAGQDAVLLALSEGGDMPIGTIASKLGVKAPTVSKAITRLTEGGLVARISVEGDRRIVAVRMTEAGRAKIGRIGQIRDQIEFEMVDALDDKERRRLRKLLRRVSKALAKAAGVDRGELDDATIEEFIEADD